MVERPDNMRIDLEKTVLHTQQVKTELSLRQLNDQELENVSGGGKEMPHALPDYTPA
jgi:bacteriocin-like protein